jgi:hypothetical protein
VTALTDIKARLRTLAPVPKGSERVVFVGWSARRSIIAARHIDNASDKENLPKKLGGYLVRTTTEFDGWAIRDCDSRGRWTDAPSAPLGKVPA